MKTKILTYSVFSFLTYSLTAVANPHYTYPNLIPDLDGNDYRALLKKNNLNQNSNSLTENKIDTILKFGQRNLEWLDRINSSRTEKIRFSTPENRRTYPVDSPSIYNETIVVFEYEKLLKDLPSQMADVLLGYEPFTDDVPVAAEDYAHFGLLVDYVYQSAARWKLMKPYLSQLSYERRNDVRGYYGLAHLENREEKLAHFNSLANEEKSEINNWLIGLCYNTINNDKTCQSNFDKSLKTNNGNANIFYNLYVQKSEQIYNDFFVIPSYAQRTDIVWSKENPVVATIPFAQVSPEIKNFLHNVELEWQWQNWQLVLNYVNATNVPHVRFEAGTTPHVNNLGGNEIVMDANLSLEEWDNQWTIRHEFGHVLGFPDCYIEFYDTKLSAIVNYQLDVSNLMCSRKGKLNEGHFLEMQRNYFN